MGGVATCISMSARAWSATTLSFATPGILASVSARLGEFVQAFDLTKLYETLIAVPTVSTDPSSLVYTSNEIDNAVASSSLAKLQAENRRATLNQAIMSRQNIYWSKYQNAPSISDYIQTNYFYTADPTPSYSKVGLLQSLNGYASLMGGAINSAYQTDNRTGVVKSTVSILNSKISSIGSETETGESTGETLEAPVAARGFDPLPSTPQGGSWGFQGLANMNMTQQEGQSGVTSTSTGQSAETQYVTNTSYTYRMPWYENQSQQTRAIISLNDETLAAMVSGQGAGNALQIMNNQLAMADSQIYQLQIGYLNTYLLPAIKGYITGVYKNPGEWVRPGDPVIRIEDWDRIYILASIKYSGAINTVGTTITITTVAPGTPETSITLNCAVVSVRGGKDERQYDLVLSVDNNTQNFPIPTFPPGHKFVLDATTVTVVDGST